MTHYFLKLIFAQNVYMLLNLETMVDTLIRKKLHSEKEK
jgi:hypothetical protein